MPLDNPVSRQKHKRPAWDYLFFGDYASEFIYYTVCIEITYDYRKNYEGLKTVVYFYMWRTILHRTLTVKELQMTTIGMRTSYQILEQDP